MDDHSEAEPELSPFSLSSASEAEEKTCGNETTSSSLSGIAEKAMNLQRRFLDYGEKIKSEESSSLPHRLKFRSHSPTTNIDHSTPSHCPFNHDRVLCWPPTLVGETASLPCMEELGGIPYNTSGLATRVCNLTGFWEKTNYSRCEHTLTLPPINSSAPDIAEPLLDTTITVYLYGFGLSLIALLAAAIIFMAFKELRCLRNTIHSHLIITYILHDALWVVSILSSIVHSKPDTGGKHGERAACITFILLHYFYLTKFWWMLVEGLYLYVLVVQTFMAESIKLRTYCLIGWGIPLVVVQIWCITRWMTLDVTNGLDNSTITGASYNPLVDLEQNLCVWLHESVYDWIHKAPALLCLTANMVFLLQIMWVLITKLRSATTPETQQSRKAAKALIVLMPLLGITYILVLIGPKKVDTYDHIRAFLISTQGFLVALFYCFLNQEVRLALRHRWNRAQAWGNFSCPCCSCEREHDQRGQIQQARDWSPRSRTESIRLYAPTGHSFPFRKRESSASETTTMTAVVSNYNGSCGAQNIVLTTIPLRKLSGSVPQKEREDTAFI